LQSRWRKTQMKGDEKTGVLTLPGPPSDEGKQCVKKALEEMAGSVPFRTSRQCQDLLRYIVLHSLSGEDELLRERMIGVEVFGRRPDYDQAADPVVRIRAADVRKRIALFYEATDAATRQVKIAIHSGSYKASFEFMGSREVKSPSDQSSPEMVVPASVDSRPIDLPLVTPPPSESTKNFPRRVRQSWTVKAVATVLLITAIYALFRLSRETAFDRFWSPVLKAPNRSVIYVGSNAVYYLSGDFVDRYRREHRLDKVESMGREFLVPLGSNDVVNGKDLVPEKDTYVTVGDTAATARIASLLSVRKKPFDMRFGGDISVGDLRERPAILIGGFNNSWTLEMTDELRFVFSYRHQIEDRFDQSRSWKANEDFTDDYAIISRIPTSKTGEILITAAGIGQAGTHAAGEFLTSAKDIDSLLVAAPRGWEKRNLQIVLHTSVINGSPNHPDVIATHYW
jgi:hypothetical protein